jgi:ACS family sodium-dependent inorganic phosphate cotransporter
MINLYTMRVNLSVAIVALTEERNVTLANNTIVVEKYFDWSSEQKGFALSAFFYGYICTQILGGIASARFGGHLV